MYLDNLVQVAGWFLMGLAFTAGCSLGCRILHWAPVDITVNVFDPSNMEHLRKGR